MKSMDLNCDMGESFGAYTLGMDEAVIAHWRELFGPEPVYEDDHVVAYRTRLAPGYSARPILRFHAGLGATELVARRTHTDPSPSAAQSLTVDLAWRALANLDQDYAIGLALVGADGTTLAQAPIEVVSPRQVEVSIPIY